MPNEITRDCSRYGWLGGINFLGGGAYRPTSEFTRNQHAGRRRRISVIWNGIVSFSGSRWSTELALSLRSIGPTINFPDDEKLDRRVRITQLPRASIVNVLWRCHCRWTLLPFREVSRFVRACSWYWRGNKYLHVDHSHPAYNQVSIWESKSLIHVWL